jgi:phosphoglycolate phosphatase-like HAD superfamily hydrolase
MCNLTHLRTRLDVALANLAWILAIAVAASTCSAQAPSRPADSAPAASNEAVGDPLPSWNDSGSKAAITSFVGRVTKEGGPDFVPVPARIATFDNDGTLWAEQPIYVQFAFALDRVKTLASQNPEWATEQPFKGVLEGDVAAVVASGEKGLAAMMSATHAGMTTVEFEQIVADWIASARHPASGRPYTSMVYQPMLELLAYLRANGFKTYVVSGGGVEFMRPWTERVYGIPPEQVIGSRAKVEYQHRDGLPVLLRLPGVDFVNDHEGKPIGIHQAIGRRPVAAFGNSDGDFEMLEWVTSGAGPRFGLIVHHTDAEREWAYDRQSHIGTLARGLDEAAARGWTVVDMRRDWKRIYPGSP